MGLCCFESIGMKEIAFRILTYSSAGLEDESVTAVRTNRLKKKRKASRI